MAGSTSRDRRMPEDFYQPEPGKGIFFSGHFATWTGNPGQDSRLMIAAWTPAAAAFGRRPAS